MSSLLKKFLLSIAVVIFIALTWFIYSWYHIYYHEVSIAEPTTIKVHQGTSIGQLAHQLTERKLVASPNLLVLFARLRGENKKIKYGEYVVKPTMSIGDLMRNITQGKGLAKHKITFIEGWTFKQIREALAKDKALEKTLTNKTDAEIMHALGAKTLHPEGLFFPDTYVFTWGTKDIDILRKSYQKMQVTIKKAWKNRTAHYQYKNGYQALIVASMIEKETGIEKERPIIAGVILRRIQKRMRLQIDPTVTYGVGKPYGSPVTRTDLRSMSPYNTYRHFGLPPTPIAMPSRPSILAALNPQPGKALYYVRKPDGSHQFSVTYHRHRKAAVRYREFVREEKKERKLLIDAIKHSEIWGDPALQLSHWMIRILR